MTARRWYASRAAAGRRPDKYAVRWFATGLMLFWTLDPVVGAKVVAEVNVNGRSARHPQTNEASGACVSFGGSRVSLSE